MQIKMSNLNYNFDNNGNTSSINISFSGNEGSNFISATMVVTPDDLPLRILFLLYNKPY